MMNPSPQSFDTSETTSNSQILPLNNSRTKLTDERRQSIFGALMMNFDGGKKFKRGTFKSIAATFNVSKRTVKRIWEQAKGAVIKGETPDVSRKFAKRVGRKRLKIDLGNIAKVPLRNRSNIRSLAKGINLSKSTVHRRIQEGMLIPHSNALKPHLTDDNKRARLQFCLSMLEEENVSSVPVFKDMLDVIHVDEKWFYMTKESEKYYLLPDEEQPVRTCKSKKFIVKIMFLAAVARPRFDGCHNLIFDGKIGIFPLTVQEPARRNSKNRVAGTLETKPITSVTKEVYRRYLIDYVLPAICEKWPRCDIGTRTIFIQHDNAKPHIDPLDVEFVEAVKNYGLDIHLMFQPPNSPDLNVLDLGFFRAIQSLQHQEAPNSVDELISAVESSFDRLSCESLNNVFLTLQQCFVEVMKNLGGNSYKMPHMGKERLARKGILPLQLQCEKELVQRVMYHLQGY